ncbi:MAG: glycosyltransferase family 4 protein [Planctomycetes bacterium]|nr:glycosyltransferase family 4 protein [Planctomycetota bacterium]
MIFISNDMVGEKVAGPGIRSLELARRLASRFEVALLGPERPPEGIAGAAMSLGSWRGADLSRELPAADVVVSQGIGWPMRRLVTSPAWQVIDLYDPLHLEETALRHARGGAWRAPETVHLQYDLLLRRGDFFLCASERQRDLWLGHLLAARRIDPPTYEGDPAARRLIDVVPFGLSETPPTRSSRPALKGAWPGIAAGDFVLLWNGGLWNWLDPVTAVRAAMEAAKVAPRLRLFFMGLKHPHPGVPEMRAAADALALARSLDPASRHLSFNHDWVPYERRADFLLDADLAVSLHHDTLEARFAFRTRLLDCLWAGLPPIATRGDALADLIAASGGGVAVPPGDVAAVRDAVLAAMAEPGRRAAQADALRRLAADFTWTRAAAPLVEWIERHVAAGSRSPRRLRAFSPAVITYFSRKAVEFTAERGLGYLVKKAIHQFKPDYDPDRT